MSDTPKPQTGVWTLTAPDGRAWQADTPLKATAAEQRERVPAEIAIARIFAACDEAAIAQPVMKKQPQLDEAVQAIGELERLGYTYTDRTWHKPAIAQPATPTNDKLDALLLKHGTTGTKQAWFQRNEVLAIAQKLCKTTAVIAQPAPKPVAWMTDDGRVATDITKQVMARQSRENFNIPLYTQRASVQVVAQVDTLAQVKLLRDALVLLDREWRELNQQQFGMQGVLSNDFYSLKAVVAALAETASKGAA